MDPFTESLVANVSPYASPFHMTSPVKRGRQSSHPRHPDLMDECSVDIYGDILDVETTFDPVTSVPLDDDKQSTSKSTFFTSNGGDEDQSTATSKQDPCTDVLTTDSSTNEEMEELKDENKKLRAEKEVLVTSKVQLTKNISCLFMTSRRELQKKDAELEELRNTVKELQIKLKEFESIPLRVTKEIRPTLSRSHENRRGASPNSSEVTRSKQSLKGRDRDQRRPSSAERSTRSSRHWWDRGQSSKESDRKERRQSPIESDRTKFKREDRTEGRSRRSQRSRDSSSDHRVNVDQMNRSERRKDMVKKSSPNPDKSCVDEKIFNSSQTNENSPSNSSKHSQKHNMCRKTSPSSSKESRKPSTLAASSNKDSSCTEKTLPKEHVQITSSHAGESSMSSKHSQPKISSKPTESTTTSSKMSHDPSPPPSTSTKLIVKQSKERPPPSPPPNPPASPTPTTDGMETSSVATGEFHRGEEEEAEHQKNSLDSEKQKQETTSVKEMERKLNSSETSKTKDAIAISPGLDHNHLGQESDSKLNKTVVSSKSHFECLKGSSQETEEVNISKNPLADKINFSSEKQSIQPSVPNVNSHSKEIKSELNKRSDDENLKIWTSVKDSCGGTRLLELVKDKDKTESHSHNNEQVVVSKLNEKDNEHFQMSSNPPSNLSQRGSESSKLCSRSSHSDSSNNARQLSLSSKSPCLFFTKSAEKSLSCLTNKEAQKPISLFDNKTGDISLTNSVVSNQDWCSMSPNSSVPFSRMNCSEMDAPSKDKEGQQSQSNNTDSQLLTNQTWPFEQRESTTLCEDVSVSMGEKTNEEKGKGVWEDGEKNGERKASDQPIRAFPISKFENDGNSVSNSNDLVSSARFSNNEGIDSLDGKPDSNVNETETTSLPSSITSESTSRNSGEACSKDSSNSEEACSKDSNNSEEACSKDSTNSEEACSKDSNSNESESTSNGSEKSSLEAKVAADNLDFHSPQKRGNLWTNHHLCDNEDGTHLTPPKPRFKPPIPQELTPAKYNNVKESTIDSPNLMCTPNLIVLGDEEATCATLFSPFKSVPSEFIPPGVRKEIKEVDTHHRHIRGKPELLHESPTPLSPSDEEFGGGVSQGEDEEEEMIPETDPTSLNDDDSSMKSTASFPVSAGTPNEVEEVALQPVLLKAFQEVFHQDLSDFKNEMIITSKNNNEILKSRLRKSAECIKQQSIGLPCGDAANSSSSARGEASVSNVSIDEQTEGSTREKGSIAGPGCPEECEETKRPPTPPTSSPSPAASLATGKRTAIVKDSVWHKSFNVHNTQGSKAKKSMSHPNVHFSQSTEEHKNSENFSCNEKNLTECNQDTTAKDFLGAEKENLSFASTSKSDQERKLCYSPVSCGVTSSGLQHVDHDVEAEKTLPIPSLQPSTSKTPPTTSTSDAWSSLEPDSTSDPVNCKQPKATGEKTSRCSKSTRDAAAARTTRGRVGLTESHSPDSPSKDLGYFKGLAATRQSPRRARKIALNLNIPSSDDASPKTSPCHDNNSDHNTVHSDGSLKAVHSDLQLSSSSSSDDSDSETDEETLNATQLLAQDMSVHQSADCDKTELVASSPSLKSPGETNKTVGRSLPAWDLMEANSLSEFDRDVILDHQRRARSARGSSRTASISSHISVGVYSPMSVSSNKMSTPSHIASPKDSLWSPMNRTSESLDSCQEDVRTPPLKTSYDSYAKELTFPSAGLEGSSFSPATEEIASIQLTRLLSLQELQRLKLVKTNFVVSHSSSESDSSSDDDSDNSSSSSSSSDSDGDKSYCYRTPVKCQKTLQSSKNLPLLNQGTSFAATPSPRTKRKTPLKSPTSLTPTALFKDKLLDSPRRSPRNKMKGESTLYEVSPRKRLNLQVHALLSPSQDAKRKRGAHVQCDREIGAQCDKKQLRDSGWREDILILNQQKASRESSLIGHEEYVKDEVMSATTTGSRKSVRIMEENWACETIVVGSCSREDHALLKRLSLGDSSRDSSSCKSPAKKPAIMTSSPHSCNNTGSNNTNTKDKSRATTAVEVKKEGRGAENSKKTGGNGSHQAKTGGGVRGCASESQVGSGPNAERRPLSLQEGIKTDPLLASSRAEFVHNVKKVTRKLDLDKENSASRKIAISPQVNFDDGNKSKSGQTADTVDKNVGKSKSGRENVDGRAYNKKSVAEPTKPDWLSDDLEEGEITSDDEEGDEQQDQEECEQEIPKINNNKGGQSSVQQKDGKKKQNNQQQSGSSRLHITQEGCTVVAYSKTAMSAKRGKNFVSRKNSDHGISPMERVDTPPLSSSLNDKNKVKRPLRGRANKRLRSLSPIEIEPEKRPVKIQRRDSRTLNDSKKKATENSRLPQQSVSANSSSSNNTHSRRSSRNVSPMSSSHHRHHRSSSSCSCKSLSCRRSNSPRRRDREDRDTHLHNSHTHRCQRSNERTATRRSREDSRGRHCDRLDRGKERPERASSRTCSNSSSCHGCEVGLDGGGRKGVNNSSSRNCRSSSSSGGGGRHHQEDERHRRDSDRVRAEPANVSSSGNSGKRRGDTSSSKSSHHPPTSSNNNGRSSSPGRRDSSCGSSRSVGGGNMRSSARR